MWAIPYQLFLPFASLYMSAIGLSDARIGAVAALSLAAQFLWALLSGAIVDKIGRRTSMLVFGLLSWTIPCALWASARSFAFFAAAAALNGMWRVTGTSFSCMIVEDGDDDLLVDIYAILGIIGLLAGFVAPVAGIFMARFSLVPTIRVLYALALLSMTVKFLVQFRLTRESAVGRRRIEETRGRSPFALAFGGFSALVADSGGRGCARARRLRYS
jgi:MFS family permease